MPGDTFKPRLITGDYFLQRQVPDEAAIQLGKDADRQRQLQHKVSRLEERIAEVEGKAPPPASVAPAPEPAASAAPAPEPSGAYDRIRARLQTVDRLHQEGLITQQEYERTRRLILDDL